MCSLDRVTGLFIAITTKIPLINRRKIATSTLPASSDLHSLGFGTSGGDVLFSDGSEDDDESVELTTDYSLKFGKRNYSHSDQTDGQDFSYTTGMIDPA